MFKVSAILGYHNVFVSVYENGSSDQTKALLRIFDALCRSVGLRVVIRTSLRTRGAFHHRIEYLAEVRNAALAPLQELRDTEGEVFHSIIFMNDVLPCVDDLLELVWQSRRQNAGITCGSDYIFHDEVVRHSFQRRRGRSRLTLFLHRDNPSSTTSARTESLPPTHLADLSSLAAGSLVI